ncbi:hypothetical protein LJK87_02705 [Paenibacillus sp. P25]|nr:hypothetical protein LJK87_02705 [Paenibacillus sp. P25]
MNAESRLADNGTPAYRSEPRPQAASPVKRWLHKDGTWAFLLLLPNILGFLAFTLIPVIASFLLSFTSWDMLSPIEWVGLDNYVNLIKDETFIKVFWNTIYYAGVSVPVGIVLSLLCWPWRWIRTSASRNFTGPPIFSLSSLRWWLSPWCGSSSITRNTGR